MAAVPTLTHDHMKQVLNQPGVSVIDVRDVQELSHQWRIEGARNIPLAEITSALMMEHDLFMSTYAFVKPRKDFLIVCHASSMDKARKGAALFKDSGYLNVAIYPGIILWKSHGGPVAWPQLPQEPEIPSGFDSVDELKRRRI